MASPSRSPSPSSSLHNSPPFVHPEVDDRYPSHELLQHTTNRKRKVSVHPLQCICTTCVQRRESQRSIMSDPSGSTHERTLITLPVYMSPSRYLHPSTLSPRLSHCPSHLTNPRPKKEAPASIKVEDIGVSATPILPTPTLPPSSPSSTTNINTTTNTNTNTKHKTHLLPRWFRKWMRQNAYTACSYLPSLHSSSTSPRASKSHC